MNNTEQHCNPWVMCFVHKLLVNPSYTKSTMAKFVLNEGEDQIYVMFKTIPREGENDHSCTTSTLNK